MTRGSIPARPVKMSANPTNWSGRITRKLLEIILVVALAVYMRRYLIVDSAMVTVCGLPIVSSLSFCEEFSSTGFSSETRIRDLVQGIVTAQDEMVKLAAPAKYNMGITEDLYPRRTALKDLGMLVRADGRMKNTEQLADVLDDTQTPISDAQDGLSKLRVGTESIISQSITTGVYARKRLQTAKHANETRTTSALSHFRSWLLPLSISETGADIKRELSDYTRYLSWQIPGVLSKALELQDVLRLIQAQLNVIRELSEDELKHSPENHFLQALWMKVKQPYQHKAYKPSYALLADLDTFFMELSEQVAGNIRTLEVSQALFEVVRKNSTDPRLRWDALSLEEILRIFEASNERIAEYVAQSNEYIRTLKDETKQIEASRWAEIEAEMAALSDR